MEASPASSGQYGHSWPKCSSVDAAPSSAGRESAAGRACAMCDAWDMPSVWGIALDTTGAEACIARSPASRPTVGTTESSSIAVRHSDANMRRLGR
jgi:hypothetical protein